MKQKVPDYIVVEGPIGVGKTSLAKKLADSYGVELLLEAPMENPFLASFYENPHLSALPTQLHFLFQRIKKIENLRQADMFRPIQIADFLIEKDMLFAEQTLTEEEFELYKQVYEKSATEAPVPDLVIYLQAPPEILIKRVLKRGNNYEKKINESYLRRISDAYVNFFYHYDQSPLLIINTENFDLVSNENNYKLLLEHISSLPPGRHYFNPQDF